MNFKGLLVCGLISTSIAIPQYVVKIPNGDKVSGVAAIGHVDPSGGGARNAFGVAFGQASGSWTMKLCQADSDGDGATNGEELGDPCCGWKVGAMPSSSKATHPGRADTFTADELRALKCSSSSTTTTSPGTTSNSPTALAPAPTPPMNGAIAYSVGICLVALVLAAQL